MPPKILILDIETSPLIVATWGLFDQNIALNQIEKDWAVIAWSAKWMGEKKIYYADQRRAKNVLDDKEILKELWTLMDAADLILTQNGVSFDIKKLNARFVLNGLAPPSPFGNIDTKRIASRKFGFTSNKLEYLTKSLCTKYKKSSHKKFPGFELWKECLKGNQKAWKEMEHYNKYDILSLEELYLKLRPWDNSYNPNVYSEAEHLVCVCGSEHFQQRGYNFTKSGKFRRYQCKACGAWQQGKVNVLSADKKAFLRR